MQPLKNHVRNYFKQHMPEGMDIIWENDVMLEIHGEAPKHKGSLKLSIPVNQKYNGMKLKVLHYKDGEIEELEGKVEKGILTITTSSLSPFAVIAGEADLPSSPNTGENKTILLWAAFGALAFAALALMQKKFKIR